MYYIRYNVLHKRASLNERNNINNKNEIDNCWSNSVCNVAYNNINVVCLKNNVAFNKTAIDLDLFL